MAIRKFVFLDPTTGQYKEQTASDSIQVANGVDALDAVNKGQLDAVAAAASSALSAQVTSLQAEIDAVEASVAAEQARAEGAEAALAADIAAEETRALAAEAGLASDIAAEASARGIAVAGVQAAVDAEVAARESAVAAEASARASAISAEQSRAETAEAGLQSAIDAAAAAAASALASEVQRATGVEAALQGAIDLLNGADTVPGSVAYDIKAAKTALEAQLDAEQAARTAADADLQSQITLVSTQVTENYSSLLSDIQDEASRALSAEASLSSSINSEIAARELAITGVQTAIDNEVSARIAAISNVEGLIAAETSAREAAITSVEGAVSAEEARALAAEGNLQTAINAEIAARENAIASAVSDLNASISSVSGQVSTVAADLAAEISRATGAEAAIAADLATEVTAREAGDTSTLAAAKLYADGLSSGLKFKDSVRFAMPVVYEVDEESFNLPAQFPQFQAYIAATYPNWPLCEVGDRILLFVKDGVSVDAGIYVVVTGGTLQRAPDMAVGSDASGAFVYVEDNLDTAPQMSGSSYVCANQKDNDIVGTAALSFVIFSRMENLTFRFGIEKTDLNQVQIKLNQTNPGLVADGSGLKLKVGDFNNLAIDSNGLKMTGTLVDGKMGLADDLHSHSVVGVKIASSESVGVFVKAGGTAVSQSSPDVLGLVIEKSGGDALVVTHGVVTKSAASFAAGDTLYVADGGGSFVAFGDVPSGKYAIPVAKKVDGTKILVQIGTAVLKA